jgi:hypothetical protein
MKIFDLRGTDETIDFEFGDVLFLNNRTTFYGGNKSVDPSSGIMHRIQIMEN